MKVFKNALFKNLVSDTLQQMHVGEAIITKCADIPQNFEIHVQRLKGLWTPCGKFTDLKTAISFATKLERPTMIEHGYQVIPLDHKQNLILYYTEIESKIEEYISDTGQVSRARYAIGESGIALQYCEFIEAPIISTVDDLENAKMIAFGNYLLSDERRERYARFDEHNLEERLSQVSDADVRNFNNQYTPQES